MSLWDDVETDRQISDKGKQNSGSYTWLIESLSGQTLAWSVSIYDRPKYRSIHFHSQRWVQILHRTDTYTDSHNMRSCAHGREAFSHFFMLRDSVASHSAIDMPDARIHIIIMLLQISSLVQATMHAPTGHSISIWQAKEWLIVVYFQTV